MSVPRRLLCWILLTALSVAQRAPSIEKVEPPNWWIGLPDPMLLLYGANLTGAKVVSRTPGISVRRVQDGNNGKYLFVWLRLLPSAANGKAAFTVATPSGTARFEFPVGRKPGGGSSAGSGLAGLSPDDVIYLIMPDRFADGDPRNNEPAAGQKTYDRGNQRAYHGGDLKGLQDKLPYLKDLGVTAIWLNPIYDNAADSPQDFHGYSAVDFYGVEDHFGRLEDFKTLATRAHALGIKLILDIVINHSGPKHRWVSDPPHDQWFHGTRERHLPAKSPFEGLVDPHAPPAWSRDLVEGWFADVLPDINTEDAIAAQYMRQHALWWIEQGHLDALRLDTFPYVDRRFWSGFHSEVFKQYPRLSSIGEVFHGDPAITSFFMGGRKVEGVDTGVPTAFDFPLYHAIRDVVLRNAPATRFVEVLRHDWLYPAPEKLITFFGNHDVKRFISEDGSNKDKLKLAFSLLLTMRGVPQLYTGDEIGMPGGEDPDNRRDFPGGFPGDASNAFTPDGRTPEQQEIFAHVQKMLKLRREYSALRRGRQTHIFADETVYAFVREAERKAAPFGAKRTQENLLIVVNIAPQAREVSLPIADSPLETASKVTTIMADRPATLLSGKITVQVPARALVIYAVECGCEL
jgi:glycosidase